MISDKDIWGIRKDYSKLSLERDELLVDPIAQFRIWFKDALKLDPIEGNAMTLATSQNNQASARIVLLKEIDDDGKSCKDKSE